MPFTSYLPTKPSRQGGIVFAQIGSRQHYAVPRVLHSMRNLETLYTDVWAGMGLHRLAFGPLRSFAGRFHPDVPASRVVSFTAASLASRAGDWLFPPQDTPHVYRRYLKIGQHFGTRVATHISRSNFRPRAFAAYNTGALEPLLLLKSWGVPTAVEQIDPARGEQEIVLKEIEKWPGWQALPGQIPDEYYARLEAEWNTATKVLVNSEWSKAALSACGVPEEKLTVMPLAYEISKNATKIEQPRKGRPTFLWLGQVILRKGIQYLIEAARLVPGVRIIVAGPIGISAQAQATAPPNVEFVGPVPRLNATDYYLAADAFVLPTMSDGFALTQLEAMAHGLPVIVTPNCARIVTDDYDGKVIPAGDSNALAAALESLAANPAGMRQMSHNALETVRHYSMAALTARLGSFFDSLAPLTNGV